MPDPSHPILYASYFSKPGTGSGGKHRNLQLLDLCRRAGGIPHAVDMTPANRRQDLGDVALGASMALANFHKITYPPRGLRRAGALRRSFRQARHAFPTAQTLVLESTPDSALTTYAQQSGLRVIAFPQNLESFFWGPRATNGFSQQLTLEREMAGLGLADHVYTISREEQWLARLFKVEARFLPYYPPAEIADQMLEVRRQRAENGGKQGFFLLLGSGDYPPTFAGMATVVRWLGSEPAALRERVLVVGHGTEKLRAICEENGVVCKGTLPFAQLEELLLQTRAIITHQEAGGGALTRVPEMLMAGIPILSNSISARSYFDYAGVYVYDHHTELLDLLNQDLPVPPVPPPPTKTEEEIIALLRAAPSSV